MSVASLIGALDALASALPRRLRLSLRWRLFRWAPGTAARGLGAAAFGFRWRLYPADNLTERLIWLNRTHPEARSLAWAMAQMQGRRALILDIGANCGAFAVPLAAAAAAGSRCLAFEPNPVMAGRLRANLRLNGLEERAEVVQVALGAGAGTALLSFAANMGEASLQAARQGTGHHITVAVQPLADFVVGADDFDVIFLKIDVESYEPEVLLPFFSAAARQLWPHHILIETEHRSEWSSDLSGALKDLGYKTIEDADGNSFFSLGRHQDP